MTVEPTSGIPARADAYLDRVRRQLTAAGFRCSPGDGEPFVLTALRSGFELTKFGNLDTFVAVSVQPAITSAALDELSATAFTAAKAAPQGLRMPRGIGEALFCHLLAVVESPPADVVERVEWQGPPKHWAASESRSLYELSTGRLHVYSRTPMWGAAYAAGQRKLLTRLFA